MRQRWRDGRAFGLLGMVQVCWGVLILWIYATQRQPEATLWQQPDLGQRALAQLSQIGMTLALILTPALTAPAIASEREAGLLGGLQISPLRPAQIVWGKFASSLVFGVLLLVIAWPLWLVTLLFGGITVTDVFHHTLAVLVAACSGAAIGLFCSAWSRRANVALRSAYTMLFLWQFGSLNAWSIVSKGHMFLVPIRMGVDGWREVLYAWLSFSNPLVIASWQSVPISPNPLLSGFQTLPLQTYNLLFQVLCSALLLWLATLAVQKPFAETYWIDRAPKKSKTAKASEPLGWWEIPVGAWLRFRNPVLAREFRGKFRMRQVPLIVIVSEALLGAGVLFFYVRTLWSAIFEPSSRSLTWWALSFIGLLVLMSATAIMGASAFTRERENGTWPGLLLARLTSGQIIGGKLGASLWASLMFSIPFWPILLPCLGANGVSGRDALVTLAILASTAFAYSAFGMCVSAFTRKTSTATLFTLAILFVADIAIPVLFSAWIPVVWLAQSNRWYNPALALLSMMIAPRIDAWIHGAICALVLTLAGSTFLVAQWLWLRRELRYPHDKEGSLPTSV